MRLRGHRARAVKVVIAFCFALMISASFAVQAQEPATDDASGAAEQVMSALSDGLTGHSAGQFLSAFDSDRMRDYATFADQVRTFLDRYDNFRVHYQIVQAELSSKGEVATVSANLEFEADDINAQAPGLSRNSQVHLTLAQGKRGWKIVDIDPRSLFQ
jgi:hypothetical protein